MDITWLGHSCFKLKGSHATVVTDPYSPEIGYSLGKTKADIVTLSHQHPGHCYAQGIGGDPKPKIVERPGEYEVGDVLIIGIATFHDKEKGAKRGKNTVYLLEIDEVSVCHLGDLGHVLTGEQVEEIDDVDVLLLPVGGVNTINAATAAEVVRQIEPKIVIPMHYKTPSIQMELDPVDKFLKEIGAKQVEPLAKLSVTKSNLPPTTQVVLLDYPHQQPHQATLQL
ncbi:MAG: MBL fold metallo-hydrolase [Dehalococcoidia bacterium]|jgi:L-ascorbate metabolism protein UlaG (beta-lactamase superfamily)